MAKNEGEPNSHPAEGEKVPEIRDPSKPQYMKEPIPRSISRLLVLRGRFGRTFFGVMSYLLFTTSFVQRRNQFIIIARPRSKKTTLNEYGSS